MKRFFAILLTACGTCGQVTQQGRGSCPAGEALSDDGTSCLEVRWDFSVTAGKSLRAMVSDNGLVYAAAAGYTYLMLQTTVTNKTTSIQSLNWNIGDFQIAIAGQQYNMALQNAYGIGGLPRDFQAGQSQSGWVIFQIPQGTAVDGAEVQLSQLGCAPVRMTLSTALVAN